MPGAARILVVEHEPDGSPDLLRAGLEHGADLTIARPYLGDPLPATAEGLGALVVLGGEMGALDDDRAPWLPATRELLAGAVRAEVPVLGICLGAQLLAVATGGRVARGAAGLELGLVEVTPRPEAYDDPFFGAVARSLAAAGHEGAWPVEQYHYDAVTELPPDAELLVTGARYPVQGYRVGRNGYAVQYHPEVSLASFVSWVRHGQSSGELTEAVVSDALSAVSANEAAQRTVADAHRAALLTLAVGPSALDSRPGAGDTVSR